MKFPLKLDNDHPFLTLARTIFPLMALGMAVLNIMGKPPQIVHDHWDRDGFGDGFFPMFEAEPDDKRFIAGMMELSGVMMIISSYPSRALGYATIALMYGRGALICRNLGLGPLKYGSVGFGSLLALWLLMQEEVDALHSLLGLTYRCNDPSYNPNKKYGEGASVRKMKSW